MAGVKLNMKVDGFFTDTRIPLCMAEHCVYNRDGKCGIKEIVLDGDGVCRKRNILEAEETE